MMDINNKNYSLNERDIFSEIFSEPIFTSIPKWRKPDFSNAYTYDNKPNYITVNPDAVNKVRNKLRRKRNRKNFLDHYLYICGSVYYLKHIDKRYKYDEFMPLNSGILTSIISERKYMEIRTDLTELDIIEVDHSYQAGEYSKGFKLLYPYDRNVKRKRITDKKMNDKINEFKQQQFKELKNLPLAYKYLAATNTWIELDFESASTCNIENYFSASDVYDSNFYSLSAYAERDYRFIVDKFGNRAHTNLTNLSSSMRPFLHVDAESLGQIDISNSQPLFFYLHIKNNPDIPETEKEVYKRIVEAGRFYEFFMEKLGITDREIVKKAVFPAIFYDEYRPTENNYMRVFREEFPSIAAYLTDIRKRDNKRLAQILQKMESKFIIENAVDEYIRRYGKQWKFISTIHDSIVVKNSMLPEAEQIINECFQKEGLNPRIKKEYFAKKKIKFKQEIKEIEEESSPYVST